jgi:hypothetical protein
MRRLLLAAGVVCAAAGLAHWASAQNAMPGQVVGTGINFNPVGTPVPKAAPQAGKPLNVPDDTPLMFRYDPNNPLAGFKGKGATIDTNTIVAPVPGIGDQTALGRFYDKVKSAVGLGAKSVTPQPTVTPGLFRRNRERHNQMIWRRD